MTTSRHAAKLTLARRDPRAAFLVPADPAAGAHGVLLQGLLEAYDPRSPRSQIRAALKGPSFALNLAGYALKNAAFIGGYLLDLVSIPSEWWPHNRVLLRLVPDHVTLLPPFQPPPAAAERVAGAPADLAHAVGRQGVAQLCWLTGGRPVMAGVAWALDGPDVVAWLPGHVTRPPRDDVPGALVIEHHHPFRATRMVGLCLRGRLRPDPAAGAVVARRYRGDLPEAGVAVRLEPARLTWWRGFEVRTRAVARPAVPAARVP
jgi:hypothetical protein